MILPIYNPFKQVKQALFPQFSKEVIYHYNPKSQTFSEDVKGWQDNYNPVSEFQAYQLNLLKGEDWQQFLKGQQEFTQNQLSLSIFSSPFTLPQYIQIYLYLTKSTKIEIKQTDQDYTRILKDVNRTFKINPFFQELQNQEALKELLIRYHTVDPELGYSQGMNFIAATILYIFSFHKLNQDQIFQIFHFIMIDREWRFMYLDDMPGLFQCLAKLNFKLKKNLPELQKHLQEMGIVKMPIQQLLRLIQEYALQIIIQLFYYKVHRSNSEYQQLDYSQYVIYSLLIIYSEEGDSIIHKLLIAMLRCYQKRIFSLKSFEVQLFLQQFCRKQSISLKKT